MAVSFSPNRVRQTRSQTSTATIGVTAVTSDSCPKTPGAPANTFGSDTSE
ncbi:hypothetical protein QE381_002448 [Microbacterium sp. SORGH_AS 888]|nr:hypothetical protein [Microbacterium sp. SORGH_AS_0888]MDQ1130320.1 hypothetical protein [Microbacterium sp. SORGH_AS_0888]